jgi:hypothetical protein
VAGTHRGGSIKQLMTIKVLCFSPHLICFCGMNNAKMSFVRSPHSGGQDAVRAQPPTELSSSWGSRFVQWDKRRQESTPGDAVSNIIRQNRSVASADSRASRTAQTSGSASHRVHISKPHTTTAEGDLIPTRPNTEWRQCNPAGLFTSWEDVWDMIGTQLREKRDEPPCSQPQKIPSVPSLTYGNVFLREFSRRRRADSDATVRRTKPRQLLAQVHAIAMAQTNPAGASRRRDSSPGK